MSTCRHDRREFLASFASRLLYSTLTVPSAKAWKQSFDIPCAKGDGKVDDTAAIQSAINACFAQGGGTVVLENGKTYLAGTLELKSNVELHLEPGATLKTIGDRRALAAQGSLLFAKDAHNVSVTGRGTIEGNFTAFFNEMGDGGYKVIPAFLGPYNPLDPPADADPQHGRPRMLILVNCRKVLLRDFTIQNAPTWTVHPINCEDLLVDGVSIHNDMLVPNCDGIDIDCCRNVRVTNCDIRGGDDCIVLKSSRNFPQYGVCENVAVTNCTLRSSSAAIKIEPEGPGVVRNAVFSNCVVAPSNRGICVFNRDGALVENLMFSDFVVATELRPRMWWGAGEPVHVSNMPRDARTKAGIIRNLQFNNFNCRGESGVFLYGAPGSPVENLVLNNFRITVEKSSAIPGGFYDLRPGELGPGVYQHAIAGVYAENVQDLRLVETSVQWQADAPPYCGSALEAKNVKNLGLRTFHGKAAHPASQPAITLDGRAFVPPQFPKP